MSAAKKRARLFAAPLVVGFALVGLHAGYTAVKPAKPAAPSASKPAARPAAKPAAAAAQKVSYEKQIRPIFAAQCQGCHQGAKPGGAYDMMAFDALVKGGASKKAAIVPGQPGKSHLLALITPKNGKAAMPMGAKPLTPAQIALVRNWIAQGAVNDAAGAVSQEKPRYDAERLPVYSRPPMITSMDYSPDGQLLAVAGFHEVLLMNGDGSNRVARLVGGSERIEAVRFSPDGTKLAVAGGMPSRKGEIQIWDVATRKLDRAVPVTSDTLYGASWSPDGRLIAFGGADNGVRAIDATTGQQVLFQGAHNDWVLGTVFSVDGSHLVSVGRDRSVKLTEVGTQRFIDNVTSITPGALKGGIAAIARHPERDEVVVGGADGAPRVYRLYRQTARQIGDDSNLIRQLPSLKGRIFTVAVSRDGKYIAAGSGLDRKGEVAVYAYDVAAEVPGNLQAIAAKKVAERSPQEIIALDKFHGDGIKEVARIAVPEANVFSLAFRPDGKSLAVAGSDGTVRLVDVEQKQVAGTFAPAPINAAAARDSATRKIAPRVEDTVSKETLPTSLKITALNVEPKQLQLVGRLGYAQLLVTARLTNGEKVDVTRMAQAQLSAPVAIVSKSGLVQPKTDGAAQLRLTVAGKSAAVPVNVTGTKGDQAVDYIRDVQPVMSKLGCNSGTCHGSKDGKAGFKLSLRGYDSIEDVRALTEEHASRRVTTASPDESLMLLKASARVPHAGGRVAQPGDPGYEIMRNWIAHGAVLNLSVPRVTGIQVQPMNPVVERIGSRQQIRVIATYADGKTRDVTREAYVDSGNTDVATHSKTGLMTAIRRGEAPLLARFEGAYAATTLTVMGDRKGFAWKQPAANNRIDELAAAKWQRMKIQPSELCTDAEFIRRVYLDLTGLPPAADDVRAFIADSRDSKVKRDELVDKLVGNPEFVEYWTNKWADLLQVNRKFLGVPGAVAFRAWIRDQVAKNTPYDEFARQILTASGSNRENPAASYFKILRDPVNTMENTTHLFLGVRFNCNKCHDHPFERWTQDQYYNLSAYFAQTNLQGDPASGGQMIGGTAVEGGKPLYEVVQDTGSGEVIHDRTQQVSPPKFPFPAKYQAPEKATRRQELAAWITSADNSLFAKSYVNRLWGYLFGIGIIEPIDDIRAGNPATNPELLDYLTQEFVKSGFDMRAMLKMMAKSRTYQLSVATNKWNADDKINYSHALPKRLQAEVLYDALHRVTGSTSRIPGLAPGTRAAQLPDSGVELESGFFGTFGRPVRESACECERTAGMQMGPVLALIAGPTIGNAIADSENEITKLVARETDDTKLINELFMRILNRPATPAEIKAGIASMQSIDADHAKLHEALKKRQAEVAPIRVKQEKDREAAIAAAKAELEAYQKELAPRREAQERQKQERTAQLQAALKEYEATGLVAKVAELEKRPASVNWTRLSPSSLSNSMGSTLRTDADMAVVASGPQGKGTYTVVVKTDLKNITALRLEALPDPSQPNGGPGRAPDGNFVLTELDVTAAPASDPGKAQKVTLQNPLADFQQQGFDVKFAVDGQPGNANQGWACSPALGGVPHWATFQTAQPVGHEGGTVLTFTLHHNFSSPMYALGRFRLSVATQAEPVGLDLADDLKSAAKTPAAERSPEQQALLLNYLRKVDSEVQRRQAEIAASQLPLAKDGKLTELEEQLALASRPVPEDGRLAQLRQDMEASTKQLENKRLTGAQDIVWALINSPAFLFNH